MKRTFLKGLLAILINFSFLFSVDFVIAYQTLAAIFWRVENLSKSGQQQELNVKIHDGIYSTAPLRHQNIKKYIPTEIQYQVRILKFWPRNNPV